MAFTLTPITQTPYWLRYDIEYDGAGSQTLTISNATLIADSHGFLRDLLNFSGTINEILARLAPVLQALIIAVDPPDAWSLQLSMDGDGRPTFVVKKGAVVAGTALVDLHFVHSMVR